jgi:hypothetical protein
MPDGRAVTDYCLLFDIDGGQQPYSHAATLPA